MATKPIDDSALSRAVKLSSLAGRVGVSMLGNKLLKYVRSDEARSEKEQEAMVRNAVRVVETLGELKGAAMKVGQMLSLHEGLLPPEVADILSALQREAPRVPTEVMRFEIEGQIPDHDKIFHHISDEGFAAASIGQVHRAVLRDGRAVAVKIQYPGIDHVIRSDLTNLKAACKSLFAMFFDIEFEPIWQELRDRLLEELDYKREADNIRRMTELHASVPEIVIPRVVEEASTDRILTLEFVKGIPPREACSETYPQELRDRWGRNLFEFEFRGLFEHRFLHADPNFANFAFLEDGRVIVYDYGCIKEPDLAVVQGYARLLRTVLEDRPNDVPQTLKDFGVYKADGSPFSRELIDPYFEIIRKMFREEPPYRFVPDSGVYERLFELGMANWSQSTDAVFPSDIIFIDRTLSGHFGNLCKLQAAGPWNALAREYSSRALAADAPAT